MSNKTNPEFDSALRYVGKRLRQQLMCVDSQIKAQTYEIRIRSSKPVMLCGRYGSVFVLEGGVVSHACISSVLRASITDLQECFGAACSYSVHAYKESICSGFVTVSCGHRIGFAGTAIRDNEKITGVNDISSVNIRISRQFVGAADELFEEIKKRKVNGLIVAGPPSCGKTTVLRDLARILSSEQGNYRKTVIIDERGELAACSGGVPNNLTGVNCDVLSSYPKRLGIQTALRSLSPEYIVADEIGGISEVEAVEEGLNSGVNFFLSVHAGDSDELRRRPQVRRLLESGAFWGVALLYGKDKPSKLRRMISAGELADENFRCDNA